MAGIATAGALLFHRDSVSAASSGPAGKQLSGVRKSPFSTDEPPNSWKDVTTYNNYYEFGTSKEDPHRNARNFEAHPWRVAVKGECDKPGNYHYDDLVSPHALEERIYRLRCVEAWSMVIPWVGIPLASIIRQLEPNSNAKYVRFKTLHDPARMPGQRRRILDWPYEEGLTIEEAMHPLTLMAVGLYGRELPNQNGAPMRLVVPWKYGFKSIKAIAEISFTRTRPRGSWERSIPREYGFYANVNPEVSHPRWSQARERRIGAGVFEGKQPTLMFNGYADQVASLYTGLDLRKNY
jgi:sulfoxide reductase catalytic subunit YedY